MKTESSSTNDPVWTHNVELLSQEECLPVIGSCQVSSILQTLDATDSNGGHHNMDLIILPSNDFKVPVDSSFTLSNNYIILKEKYKIPEKKRIIKNTLNEGNIKKNGDDIFEDMLYFVCNLCPFLCTESEKITQHLENAHKNKTTIKLVPLKCPACANIFYHKMSLRSHLIHDHGVGNLDLTKIIPAVIYYANQKSAKKKQNKQKVLKPTVIKRFSEPEKQSNISDEAHLPEDPGCREEDPQQESKVIVLPKVDLMQKKSDMILNSLQKQLPPVTKGIDIKKANKCIIPACNVKFQDMEKLNYHISCHTDSGFECAECGEKFIFWKPLTSHLWRVHKIDMDLFSCDKCDYKTYSLSKLNNIHKLIHSDVRGFSCPICSKAFKNSKQLRNHKMTHKDPKDKLTYHCEICTKHFAAKKQLRVHMDVVHKKIKPFLCSYCGYKGSSRSALKMHVRQHTGEKPFSCDYCSYTSADHNSLRRHKLRHTGQKPYKCSYCSYECIQSSTYKTHLKTKHPGMEKDLMFTCSECQFRSVNKDIYLSHMISAHKVKP